MKRILGITAVVVLLAFAVVSQFALKRLRPDAAVPAVSEGAIAALGAFRSIAAEIVWFRADRLQEDGRYSELAQLATTLTFLEPHTPEVWSYAAWNLAYNISVMMPTHADRWRWVHAALKLLRDNGLKLNPREAALYRELAWMFELKIGADIDAAGPLYRTEWRKIVEDVAARGAWTELAMDEAVMREVESCYRMSDRSDARFSAVYWAHLGLKVATDAKDAVFLREIIRQSRVLYAKAH